MCIRDSRTIVPVPGPPLLHPRPSAPPKYSARLIGLTALGLLLALSLAGCSTLRYYGQAVGGGLDLLRRREPIPRLLADPSVSPELKERLQKVRAFREFAVTDLGLPDNRSYRTYADLGRPYAVWTVTAAPELSVEPRVWCFPIAGCVTYRGYFSRERALAYAAGLAEKSYDVEVGGVAAYSTLGRLADPVLSTFIGREDLDLAGLLFHELAHQVAYAPDDTTFNESFASVVEEEGVRRWLLTQEAEGGGGADLKEWREIRRRDEAVIGLLLTFRERLAALYAQAITDAEKRRRKAETFAELRADYHRLVAPWGGTRWDAWIAQDLNNAHLAAHGAYHELTGAFAALLAEQGGDLPAFYADIKRLAAMRYEERRAVLVER